MPEGHVVPTTGNRGKMADLTVAKTILEQLGGEHFVAMTGAKDFVGTEDSLTFTVGSNPKHVSHVRVTQTPGDLYAVTFLRGARRRRSWTAFVATHCKRSSPITPASISACEHQGRPFVN